MSYLYTLINHFYNELLEVSRKNGDVESIAVKNLDNVIATKSNDLYTRIKFNEKNYYGVLKNIFQNDLNDLDLLSDYLTYITYESKPPVYSYGFDHSMMVYYQNEKDMELKTALYQLIKIQEVFNFFVLLVRRSYLPNFIKNEFGHAQVESVFEFAKNINFYNTYSDKGNGNYDLLDSLKDSDDLRQDFVSNFVDSNETRELIVNQQRNYIKELDELLELIDKVGNITNLSDEQFEVIIKFIFYFKEMAYRKIDILKSVNNKIYKKALNRF